MKHAVICGLAAVLSVAGCGDDNAVIFNNSGGAGAGSGDGASRTDAQWDAGDGSTANDGSKIKPQDDSGNYYDGGEIVEGGEIVDGGDASSGGGYYTFGKNDLFDLDIGDVEGFYDQRGFDLKVNVAEFAVVFENHQLGEDCKSRIDLLKIPTYGEIPSPVTEVNAKSSECSSAAQPAIVASGDSYQILWTDDRSGQIDLYSRQLASSKINAITDNTSVESEPAIAIVNKKTLAAWISEDSTGKRAIYTQLIDVSGSQPIKVISEKAGRLPQKLVISRVALQAAIGWVDLNEDTRGIFVMALTDGGKAVGDPQQLLVNPAYAYDDSSLDIAGANNGGAVVYSISIDGARQIRFMRLSGAGDLQPETDRKVIAPPRGEAKDASIVKWGSEESNQYMIAYRAIPSGDIPAPMIRMVAVDLGVTENPETVTPLDVADNCEFDGGRTKIALANDGTILIAWVDTLTSSEKSLHAVRLQPGF